MAQNVTVAGASYSDVPSVQLPKTGGGTATFTDVSDTTAAAADVASGKYFYTAAGVKTAGTASGGGGTGTVVIEDTTDSAGGTVRTITAVDISDTTAVAADVAQGKYFYDSSGTKTAGAATPSTPTLQIKTATPTESQQTISPDSGYDGLSSVTVGAVSSTYVGSGVARKSSSDLTASGLTVTAPVGYYASAASKTLSDQNLVAGNIKKDVTIFGTTGTYEGGGGDDGKWHRPANYPNLDSIVVTNDCVVYLTYDLTKATSDEQKYISVYCQGAGNKQSTIERGHLNGNNEFVADATYTTSSYIFSQALDPQNGDVQLWRAINNTYGINRFAFNDFNSISGSSRWQPCIEMLASGTSTLPAKCLYSTNIPTLMENLVLKNYIGDNGYQGIYYAYGLKRVSLKDAIATLTDSRNFFQHCQSLTEVVNGENFVLKAGGSGFWFCGSLKKLVYPKCSPLGASPNVLRNADIIEDVDLRSLDVTGVTSINVSNFFNDAKRLKKLNMSGLNFSGLTSGTVSFSFPMLEDFYPPKFYIGQTWNCPMLSVESLVRLLDVLPSVGSATTVTIGAFNISKLTAAQIAVATAKGWTVA